MGMGSEQGAGLDVHVGPLPWLWATETGTKTHTGMATSGVHV